MATKGQLTGMRGVFLVAAELCSRGFIVSPTSRSAIGADILATDESCKKTFSIQVKTNAKTFNAWLLSKKASKIRAESHIYVFVNIRSKKGEDSIEYYVVPSKIVAKNVEERKRPNATLYAFYMPKAQKYKDNWSLFG